MDFAQVLLMEILISLEILGQQSRQYLLGEQVIFLWTYKLSFLNTIINKTIEECPPPPPVDDTITNMERNS